MSNSIAGQAAIDNNSQVQRYTEQLMQTIPDSCVEFKPFCFRHDNKANHIFGKLI